MDYAEYRKNIAGRMHERMELKDLATFVPNKKTPVYNWFYYKEGFARQLVEMLIDEFGLVAGSTVLDPFCGSGTTLLCCKEKGINAVGYDVLPISVFASRVKTAQHDTARLEENARKLTRARFIRVPHKFSHLLNRSFSKYALEDIAFIRSKILDLEPETREFFVLALINAAMKVSYAYKDGGVIKFRKHPAPPLRKLYARVARKMMKDISNLKETGVSIVAEQRDARRLPLTDESIDSIITSPPYLNNIDYTRVYSIEEFFIHGREVPGVRAFVGISSKESEFLPELSLPNEARLYFEDMNEVLKEMHRVLKTNGKAAVIVGNGYVDGEVIESDIILAYLAEKIGFTLERIDVLNTRFALEDRTTKKGVLRESMLILRK